VDVDVDVGVAEGGSKRTSAEMVACGEMESGNECVSVRIVIVIDIFLCCLGRGGGWGGGERGEGVEGWQKVPGRECKNHRAGERNTHSHYTQTYNIGGGHQHWKKHSL